MSDEINVARLEWPETGRALAGRFYSDPLIFEREKKSIFSDDWFFLAPVNDVAHHGDYVSVDVAGEPLLLTRAKDGKVRVMSRVCRHRHMVIVEGSGNRSSFTCPYHSWTYKADGELIGAPLMDQVPGFEKKDCGLRTLRTEIWNGLVFCTMSETATPLHTQLTSLDSRFEPYQFAEWTTELVYSEEIKANWKIIVENATESYHHLGAHKNTLEHYTPAKNVRMGEVAERFSSHHLWPANMEPGSIPEGTRKVGKLEMPIFEANVGGIATIFPNMVLAASGEGGLLAGIFPQNHDRTIFKLWTTHHPSMSVERYAKRSGDLSPLEFIDKFNSEDLSVTQGVERGMKSQFATGGPLHKTEMGLEGFYRYLQMRL
ncbi:aromatic ring-hydroxylating dioxygenase subunit alpha [Pseudomonas sp. BGr12]|uniref:aromatic ring-hydroxylating oxygenase subunit alpha n=1 Tax=Pseudomonas sp. BGr12 TaxID=2936269 RepID=UPI00255A3095|nr:aromatic ring-hydroxylating dioxygenase subunit alpha [Pseudomonas sp. BJa5]MDL2428393.1 aromatic ring-hydroxylating dioxygenase subunit alpha [Pseudomonas sp. BJa5]